MNDDLISRQAAMDYLLDALYDLDEADYVDKEFIEEELKRVPSVQPKQKTGQWIYGQDEIFVSCSECGMETTRNEIRGIALFGKDEPKFCPNCGAKMEE